MEMPVRKGVFIVEDSASIRSRLVEMLEDVEGIRVVGEAESPAQATAAILETLPDLVILDFQLIGGTGVEVMRAVRPVLPEVAFLVLTNHPNPQYRRICMEAGAHWFFDKSTEFGKIKDVIATHLSLRRPPREAASQ
jgi:DNA-binding NarL/FixJ family response regulator